ncbi:MAG: YdcF family protein [Pyrinomonadaceae bacterium]|nr:YdcF family protein [Pyrinomonadaceae bacterium]MCX7639318.1 YdcF family protein [Pyrinomonadaceae bacterium]MDW8303460.1 YdcF family protein [Acidobacteriota bacterium]
MRLWKTATLFFLIFICWTLVSPFLAEWLIVETPLERAEAIFVLGGSAAYLERTEKAASIYKQGIARKIFLTDDGEESGWSEIKQRNPTFVELAKENLILNGVREEDIQILSPKVTNTSEEITLILKTARDKNLTSIYVVTSAYHTRRVKVIFSHKAVNVRVGILHAETGWQMPQPQFWWLSVFGWKVVAGEYIKICHFLIAN